MPVRSLRSPVLKWPRRDEVLSALKTWVDTLDIPGLLAVGVFGSYARGDCGVGSDLDILIVLSASELPFERRMAMLNLESLPVPAEVLVYTLEEWRALPQRSPRLAETLAREAVWTLRRPGFC